MIGIGMMRYAKKRIMKMNIDFLGFLAFVIGFGWIPILAIIYFFYYIGMTFIKLSRIVKKN